MSTKVTAIIGEPCTGKSRLMKSFMSEPSWEYRQVKWTPHHVNILRNIIVLGRYDDVEHPFPGTDRLSMAVQPHALKLIESRQSFNILFEGDRLGNRSMLEALIRMDVDLEVIVLQVDKDELANRRAAERQDQDAKFVGSRETKIKNLLDWGCAGKIRLYQHNTESDTQEIVRYLKDNRV